MSNYPQFLLSSAIAALGDKVIPPATAQEADTGRLSQEEGWTNVNSKAIGQGGIPPKREDFNSVLFLLSQFLMWYQQGGLMSYSDKLDYEVGNEVRYKGVKYRCAKANGVSSQTVEPGTDTEYWTNQDAAVQYIPQVLEVLQKAQARKNIGLVSKAEADSQIQDLVENLVGKALQVKEKGYGFVTGSGNESRHTSFFYVEFSFGLIIQGGITTRAYQRQNIELPCPFKTDFFTGVANVYNMADGKRSVTIQSITKTNIDMGSGEGRKDPQSYRKTWLAIGF